MGGRLGPAVDKYPQNAYGSSPTFLLNHPLLEST